MDDQRVKDKIENLIQMWNQLTSMGKVMRRLLNRVFFFISSETRSFFEDSHYYSIACSMNPFFSLSI